MPHGGDRADVDPGNRSGIYVRKTLLVPTTKVLRGHDLSYRNF